MAIVPEDIFRMRLGAAQLEVVVDLARLYQSQGQAFDIVQDRLNQEWRKVYACGTWLAENLQEPDLATLRRSYACLPFEFVLVFVSLQLVAPWAERVIAAAIQGIEQGEDLLEGPLSRDYLIGMYRNLGDIKCAQGNALEGESCYDKALRISHPDSANGSLDNAPILLRKASARTLARQLKGTSSIFQEGIALLEAQRSEMTEEHATAWHNLAHQYAEQGEHARAVLIWERVLNYRHKMYGERYPNYLTTLCNYGQALAGLGKLKQAEKCLRRCFALSLKIHGEHHSSFSHICYVLAYNLKRLDNLTEAAFLYRRALDIDRELMGEDHPDITASLHNLGQVYISLGDFDQAEQVCHEAVRLDRNRGGDRDPNYGYSLAGLSRCLEKQERFSESCDLLGLALDILREGLGVDHPDVIYLEEKYFYLKILKEQEKEITAKIRQ